MSEDERTVGADPGVLDELKRFASEARRSTSEDSEKQLDDPTVDADAATMDELKRFALQARQTDISEHGDATPPQGVPVIDTEARERDRSNASALPLITSDSHDALPPISLLDIGGGDLAAPSSMQPLTDPMSMAPKGPADQPDLLTFDTDGLTTDRVPLPLEPADDRAGFQWSPPARMVMPTDPVVSASSTAGPWRWIALGLGVALAVAVAIIWFTVLGDGGDPTDDEPVPGGEEQVDEGQEGPAVQSGPDSSQDGELQEP